MKNLYFIGLMLISILSPLFVSGQVNFVIDSIPAYTPAADQIYIVGNFNGWNPGDPNFMLQKNEDDKWAISLNAEDVGADLQYKFTRGDWGRVEKGPDGEEIGNRTFTFGTDSVVHHIVYNWADNNGGGGSTAAENVSILDEAFEMPQLNRTRRIWIYLPPGYDESEKSYPVIYMHDGQNLFDETTSFAGEWEVDETLNELADEGFQVPIVIGIDNGGAYRGDEYMPWYDAGYDMGGQGDLYMDFIVETLKPYVDASYRTLSGRENTGLMGSSLGALISAYGSVKYQEVFAKTGSFSPAYWINYDSLIDFVGSTAAQENLRFYQSIGENEGNQHINHMYAMEEKLNEVGFNEVVSKVISGAGHNEATWRDDFGNAYLWLFDSFASDVSNGFEIEKLEIIPNPAKDHINLENTDPNLKTTVKIYDTLGHCVFDEMVGSKKIDVSSFSPGTYIIKTTSEDKHFKGSFIKL